MLNHIDVMGRLTRDPEMRRTGSGLAVTSFTLAVDRDYSGKDGGERETDFIDCVAWRQTGEFVSKYFAKGQMAAVSGRLQIRNWEDKDGQKRRTAEILVDHVYFCGKKENGSQESRGACSGYSAPADAGFAPLEDDDSQLPF
jgi:single-strand DNA-binding protein